MPELTNKTNPVKRKSAAANGLLRWLHARDPYGLDFQRLNEAFGEISLEGEDLPEELIMAAADRLSKLGLVEAALPIPELRGLPLVAKLTDPGQALVESERTVEDFMADQRHLSGYSLECRAKYD